MADRVSKEKRSQIMSSVGVKDTGPEMAIRRTLNAMGYRYRLHRKGLPGTPDLVFPGRSKIVFVHGCFWHGHGCRYGKLPKSKMDYWGPKIEGNKKRDVSNRRKLRRRGWEVLVIWQCQLKDPERVRERLVSFLGLPGGGKREY